MKACLFVFMPFLLSISEGSLSIPNEGIVQELLGGKKEIVETPQFQEEVFVPEAEITNDEVKNVDQKIVKEDQNSIDKIVEEEVTSQNTEAPSDLDKQQVVENPQEHHEETVSQEEAPPFELEKEHPLVIGFEGTSESNPACFQEEEPCERVEHCFDYTDPYCDPQKQWYFTLKPGYFYFKDKDMRRFFDGGFTFRAEVNRRFWDYYMVWIDAGYFEKKGTAIGGTERLRIKLATITLGLKGIYYFNPWAAIYGGLGPRLFMMMLHNGSPYVRSDDNEIGIGGGFTAGFLLFPAPQWENLYLDFFADYSMKKLKVEPDEISSSNYDVDVSGLTAGVGIGFRF